MKKKKASPWPIFPLGETVRLGGLILLGNTNCFLGSVWQNELSKLVMQCGSQTAADSNCSHLLSALYLAGNQQQSCHLALLAPELLLGHSSLQQLW